MIHEAIDAAVSVGWALLVWVVLLAMAATCALYTVVVAVVCAVLAARRGVVAVLSLVQHSGGGELVRDAPEAVEDRQPPSWSAGGVTPSTGTRRVLGAPLVHRRFRPHGSAADLLRLGEVGNPADEVVDALPVDAETCCDLVRREVAGDVHVSTVAPSSSPSTGSME